MSRKKQKQLAERVQNGREWFDREYSGREVYSRLWGFARRYRRLIFCGALLGMITGGAWVPIFAVIKPLIEEVQPARPSVTLAEQIEDQAEQIAQAAADVRHSAEGLAHEPEQLPVRVREMVGQTEQIGACAREVKQTAEALYPERKKNKPEQERAASATRYAKYVDKATYWLDKVGIHGTVATLMALGLIVALAVLLKMITQFLNQYLLTKAGMLVVMDVRNAMFIHLQQQSLAFHGRSDVGRLMSRASTDPETIRTLISQTMSDLCRAPFEVLGAIGFVCVFAVQNNMLSLLLIAVMGYPLCMFPVVWLGRQIRKWSQRLLEQSAGIGSNFHENLTCIRVVKAYHTEAAEIDKYCAANAKALKICLRAVRLGIMVGPLTETVAIVLAAVFVIYCFATGHGISEIFPLVPPFLILYKPMKQIGRLQAALEGGRAALQRIFSLLDVHEELVERPDAVAITEFKRDIVFDHVSFSYVGSAGAVIRDANFTIRRGQMFAVVGATGSGKSTLGNLLARFYDVTEGQVRIDGRDIRDYRIADIRNLIGAVTQESILFNATIAENIAYGSPNATQEQIEEAAKLANAHAFIMAHPEGYSRVVGEKGFVLSGGERQRVAIARAILKNPPILILDEATSALDTVTEQQVQAAIDNLMTNRTTFAVAHRLSTIQKADCILVMDHGVIVERGTHEELYAKGGIYRRLCDIQNRQSTEMQA